MAIATGTALLAGGALAAGATAYGASKSSKAAKSAAQTQSRSIDTATAEQRRATQQARSDLQPFRQAGQDQIQPLAGLVDQTQTLATDPSAQLSFVQDNPFFKALADDSQKRLFQNQAAKGKLGSGGTAEALQNSILLLGQDLINGQLNRNQQSINNRQGIMSLGQNAAAGQGGFTANAGTNISNLATARGDVQAAGQVGAANAVTGGINNLVNAGLGGYQIYQQSQNQQPVKSGLDFVDTSVIPGYRYA